MAYNFLGEYVNSLNKDDLKYAIEYIGLNDLLNKINDTANDLKMTVPEVINYLYNAVNVYIDEYDKYNRGLPVLSPVFEDIVLVELDDLIGNEISYDVYTIGKKHISPIQKEAINNILESLSEDVSNSNIIIIFIDIIKYGVPICKLYFNDI